MQKQSKRSKQRIASVAKKTMIVLLSPLSVCMFLCALIFGLFDSVRYVECLNDVLSYFYPYEVGTYRQQVLVEKFGCIEMNGSTQTDDSKQDLHLHHPCFSDMGWGNGTGKGMGDGKGERGTGFNNNYKHRVQQTRPPS